MTATVKLPEGLEAALRLRCEQEGRSLSEVMRDALSAYLANDPTPASAWSLGQDLFGRHRGQADLAEHRKRALGELYEQKHQRR